LVASVLVVCVAMVAGAASWRRSPDDVFVRANTDPATAATIRGLAKGLPRLDRSRTYEFVAGAFSAPTPVGYGLIWRMYRAGYDVRVPATDPYLGRAHAAPAKGAVHVWVQDATVAPPPGSTFLAVAPAPVPDLDWALAGLRRWLGQLRLPADALTAKGRALAHDDRVLARVAAGDATGADVVQSADLHAWLEGGVFETGAEAYGFLRFYDEARHAKPGNAVALFAR
jgi:hypothetical protein